MVAFCSLSFPLGRGRREARFRHNIPVPRGVVAPSFGRKLGFGSELLAFPALLHYDLGRDIFPLRILRRRSCAPTWSLVSEPATIVCFPLGPLLILPAYPYDFFPPALFPLIPTPSPRSSFLILARLCVLAHDDSHSFPSDRESFALPPILHDLFLFHPAHRRLVLLYWIPIGCWSSKADASFFDASPGLKVPFFKTTPALFCELCRKSVPSVALFHPDAPRPPVDTKGTPHRSCLSSVQAPCPPFCRFHLACLFGERRFFFAPPVIDFSGSRDLFGREPSSI